MSVGVQLTHGAQPPLCPDPGPRAELCAPAFGIWGNRKGDENLLQVQGQRPCQGQELTQGHGGIPRTPTGHGWRCGGGYKLKKIWRKQERE